MSAKEIIAEIEKLAPEEREEVSAYVFEHAASSKKPSATQPVSAEFERIADEVFTKNAELFRKLAQ